MSIAVKRLKALFRLILIPIFLIVSTDNAFALSLNVKGLFQFQYETNDADTEELKINEMSIRRLKLTFSGNLTREVSFRLEPEYGKGEPDLKDAYFKYVLSGYHVRLGNHLTYFGSEAAFDDKNLLMVERHLTSQLSPERNVGISISKLYRQNQILFRGGLWSGSFSADAEKNLISNRLDEGQIFSDHSNENETNNITIGAVRFEYRIDGFSRTSQYGYSPKEKARMAFGLGFYQTTSAADQTDILKGATSIKSSGAFELDFRYRHSIVDFELELARRNLEWKQISFAENKSDIITSVQQSASLQLFYPLTSRWSFAARYETFAFDIKDEILKGPYGEDSNTWITLGCTVDFDKQNTRLQFNYIIKDEEMASSDDYVKNNTALIQTTVSF